MVTENVISMRWPRRLVTAATITLVAMLSACGASPGGGGSSGSGNGGDGQPGGGITGGGQTDRPPTGGGPAGGSPTAARTSATDTRPIVGNIEMSPSNVVCSYVPHGSPDGSDGLTMFGYVLLIGANSLPGPLKTSVSMSNGYSAAYTGGPSNRTSVTFQGPIRSGDWGRRLTVTIRTDPDDRYRETNESDNTIEVSVPLPATRPTRTIDPLSCSARRV